MTITRLPPRVIKPGGGGDLLAEIARQTDQRHPRIVEPEKLDRFPCRIVASVIDIYRLPRAERLHRANQTLMEPDNSLGLIQRRN